MPALNTSAQAPVAQVIVMEIRRQMIEAVHTPEIIVPDDYTMKSQAKTSCPAPALALPQQGLRTLVKALLAAAPAPNAKLLAAKRKAQEWFG